MGTKTRAATAVVVEGGYMVGYADLDVPGYTPTTYEYDSYEEAKSVANSINESWGVTPDEAIKIVASSMRGGVSS